ncbi:hypothetical protein CGLO_09924 [Colletotrichum gloeosporioides Cg-14]|uniref:Uncharacterized protein n=1 Tax=Colletotrichum gloeosporioides (strain Cg-14) TaxID=1237896 RepID=T0KES3_COLGC|nr:hypothetical protein CGLO_09924 [Colletotrichum gloeosporioides Cg-14]
MGFLGNDSAILDLEAIVHYLGRVALVAAESSSCGVDPSSSYAFGMRACRHFVRPPLAPPDEEDGGQDQAYAGYTSDDCPSYGTA